MIVDFKTIVRAGKIVAVMVMVNIFITNCDRLAVKDTIEQEYTLVNQQNQEVIFPTDYLGDVLVVGYVYTNCPDICPMITYNMRDLQRLFPDEENFTLISISFDPERDSPEILQSYAEGFNLDQKNWKFLTGNKNSIESVLDKLGISTVKTPTRFLEDDTPIYFIDHTDKVTLIDKEGQIRNHYLGSELQKEKVAEDIKQLLTEK